MKISKVKTFEDAINALEDLEKHGGIRRDTKDRIIPVSTNAVHLFNRAKELAPSGSRWDKLSPESASVFKETASMRETSRSLSQVDIRTRHHR